MNSDQGELEMQLLLGWNLKREMSVLECSRLQHFMMIRLYLLLSVTNKNPGVLQEREKLSS